MNKDAHYRRSVRLAKSPPPTRSSVDTKSSKSPSLAKESPPAGARSAKPRSSKPSTTLVPVVKSGRAQPAPVTTSESVDAAGDSSSSDDEDASASSEEEHGWRSQPVPLKPKGQGPDKVAPAVYLPTSEGDEARPNTKNATKRRSSSVSQRSVEPKGKSGGRQRSRSVAPPSEQSAGEESEESERDAKGVEHSEEESIDLRLRGHRSSNKPTKVRHSSNASTHTVTPNRMNSDRRRPLSTPPSPDQSTAEDSDESEQDTKDGDHRDDHESSGRSSPSALFDGEESPDDDKKDFERQTSHRRADNSAPPRRRLLKGPPAGDPAPSEHTASGSDDSGADSDSKPRSYPPAAVRKATPYKVQPKKRVSRIKSTLSADDSGDEAFDSPVDTLASTQVLPPHHPVKHGKTAGHVQHPPVRRGSTTPEKPGKRRRATDQASKQQTSPLKRVKSSPTKEPVRTMQRAHASLASTRTLYVLGTTTRPLFKTLVAFDEDLLPYNLLLWDTADRGQFVHGMKAASFQVANLPAAKSSRYGTQHIVDGNVTFSKPSKRNIVDLDTPLSLDLKSLNYVGANGKPHLAFFQIRTADIDDRPNNKAPNVRMVVYADGFLADAISWASPEDVAYLKSKVSSCYDPAAAGVYALTQVSYVVSRHAGYYELKTVGPAMFGDRFYFKHHFPKVYKEFSVRRASHGGELQDTTFPKVTAFKALADTQFQTSDKPTFVAGVTLVIQGTGSELTIPICPTRDCGLMCGYPSETGPFTCADHGEVDPMIVSRPTATALIRVEDNRSVHTDRDYPLSFTVASGQEETYLNMTLEELHEDFDVDKVRSQLVGQRFLCTLCISKSNVTATQMRRPDHAVRSASTA
jgi:hypothetical protein